VKILARMLVAAAIVGSGLIAPHPAAAGGKLAILVGAGDIASCGGHNDDATAAVVARQGGVVFTAGDNVYDVGSYQEFLDCYAPSWGRFKDRTSPAPGNHDYDTPGGAGYYRYFGARAGTAGKGWYAYNRATWRIYVLNSNCSAVGGCSMGSPQQRWLAADLAAHPHRCVLAYWHHPRFSSGKHGNNLDVQGFWITLYRAGAELVVNGHDHDYERFAKQNYYGQRRPYHGIREFVVGTGGAGLRPFPSLLANSVVSRADTFGVLKLVLRPGKYSWQFLPAAGGTFTDSGRGVCH
jgi:3',5'-cyclic AMP phosphodiesterase CpdA